MTPNHLAGWRRLQEISLYHATEIYCSRVHSRHPRSVSVPAIIKENVDILGRGTEEDVKYRIYWYLTFYPSVFDASRAKTA